MDWCRLFYTVSHSHCRIVCGVFPLIHGSICRFCIWNLCAIACRKYISKLFGLKSSWVNICKRVTKPRFFNHRGSLVRGDKGYQIITYLISLISYKLFICPVYLNHLIIRHILDILLLKDCKPLLCQWRGLGGPLKGADGTDTTTFPPLKFSILLRSSIVPSNSHVCALYAGFSDSCNISSSAILIPVEIRR